MRIAKPFAALILVLAPSVVSAQSLLSTRGLGLPVAPVDARARALGGMGLGLPGLNTSLVNPAEMAGLRRRGIVAVLQPGSAAPNVADQEGKLDASRFPLVRLFYPFGRVTATIGYGSYFEQSWGIRQEGRERIGSDSVDVVDVVESTGGMSRVVVGAAMPLSDRLAVGAEVGLHAGVLDRNISRTFADTAAGLNPFSTRYRWGYRGPFATLGVRWDPTNSVRLSSSLTLADRIDIEGRTSQSVDDEFNAPLRIAAGASAWISSLWMATAGLEWSGNGSGDESVFSGTDAVAMRRDAWRFGGGIEYQGVQSGLRVFPFRLGASYQQLPFYNLGEDPASEWSAAAGLGFRLAGDPSNPLAVVDVTYERGKRSGLQSPALPGGVTETFWRFTFSLSLFGN